MSIMFFGHLLLRYFWNNTAMFFIYNSYSEKPEPVENVTVALNDSTVSNNSANYVNGNCELIYIL